MQKRTPDQIETTALQPFVGPVIKELSRLRDNRQLSTVCRDQLGGLAVARLTEIITGKRLITGYYLGLLIQGKVIYMDHILQGKGIEDMPEDLQPLLKRLSMPTDLVNLCFELRDAGITVDQIKNQLNILLDLRK